MDQRKERILFTIIKEHIKTGAPVGSNVLVENYHLGVSAATVRHEMVELEDEGYIRQPHTSAGRVPTERAYNLFVRDLGEKKPAETEKNNIDKALAGKDETGFKNAAKVLAKLSGNAVFWAFYRHNVYYTGVSDLLRQPEFRQSDLIYDISAIIDRLDEIIDRYYDKIEMGTQILIGSKNPFGAYCSALMAKYKQGDHPGLFGIIGPLRMDYARNKALVEYIYKTIVV
ncbi:MAG: hypothetical protein MUC28_02515 [Planctomycetes bacterium]|jgi:heat-inducible transcriptional repressor|nr:hypothetical protein [Planctomycetota bacterium]